MQAIVPIIIVAIIFVQISFFVKNKIRMDDFSAIFDKSKTWSIHSNIETRMVDGIFGKGNTIFKSIINSINKYLGNNSGSEIDFGLLKDAVDRHCDSVENDISTQIPLPLYLGLVGTMAGVIIGLWDLLDSDAISALMGSSSNQIKTSDAAGGINALLEGVAWAMSASICGILLTTIGSILFKSCKLKEENGKNSFLAWMQSELLPELPSNTSQAMNTLVRNLNKFNSTFAENSSNLGDKLKAVNESYAIQADIIKTVHDMDVTKMANANVKVLQELNECTDKLKLFNKYLSDIEGYTETIHHFETMFNEQANRLHVLEEIRDFFRQYKGSIAKTVAEVDKTLQESLQEIKNSTSQNVAELHSNFVRQSENLQEILKQEKDTFEEFLKQMNTQFSAQVSQMPQIVAKLDEISGIPARLDKLIEKIEKSNTKLASDISSSLKQAMKDLKTTDCTNDGDASNGVVLSTGSTPDWMKYAGLTSLIIIAFYCVFNIVVNIATPKYPQTIMLENGSSVAVPVDSVSGKEPDSIVSKSDSLKLPVLGKK